ncbi:MAG: tRNA wybutosine-synthesizing 3 family protein [Nanoarchaeota archaeon]|nr:tRNA wybutosine-synthesizing 3 family protein [Nanoarchaeota archaeon]
MNFPNNKKTFLAKSDKSKKGSIDEKVVSLLETINNLPDYYSTSSCSGRVYLWKGTGKKSETQWLKVSHDLIGNDFFDSDEKNAVVWLRLEGMIMHIACKDLGAANALLEKARKFYKKSCILTASSKIIVEIRGSEFMEMPLYKEGKLLFSGDLLWLKEVINQKLEKMWKDAEKFRKSI